MESVVCAVAEKDREALVGALVEIVTELVMDRREVLGGLTSMHILMRRSSTLSMSQALAWQTTSRSRGLTNSDRSQNVFGSGSKPSDVKNRSAMRTISSASTFLALSRSVSENVRLSFRGATRS